MSVLLFGEEELVTLVLACSSSTPDALLPWCELVSEYAEINSRCFYTQYKEWHQPPSYRKLYSLSFPRLDEAKGPKRKEYIKKATETAQLMHYNCVTNNGEDLLESDHGAACAMVRILARILSLNTL